MKRAVTNKGVEILPILENLFLAAKDERFSSLSR